MKAAVVDIGSNSIKVLVARQSRYGRPEEVFSETIEARISAGISGKHPRLRAAGMDRGAAAIRKLLRMAAHYSPDKTLLVATSAVRDARNGAAFKRRVREATGQSIRVLTGDEEADLIGRGLACDPALARLRNFYVFDLGGGSLECLAFRDRSARQSASLQLGCVRLTEKFVADPARPLTLPEIKEIAMHVGRTVAASGFEFNLPRASVAVGSGGTLTTIRSIRAERDGVPFERTDPVIPVGEIHRLFDEIALRSLAARRRIPGLPPARADVFPAALATLISIASLGSFEGFRHSLYNLRWGLAARLME